MTQRPSEKGNILILILVAVALFAALGYTVSNMIRSGNPARIGEEQAGLYAGELLEYGRKLRRSVQIIRISNGCADTDVSFDNTIVGGYVNGANTECQVFHTNGGGTLYQEPDLFLDISFSAASLYGEWFFTGSTCIEDVGGDETNCHTDTVDNSELIAFLPYLNQRTCLAINNKLGITNPGGDAPIDADGAWHSTQPKFQGIYTEHAVVVDGGVDKTMAAVCFKSTSTFPPNNAYTFMQVLIPR